MVLIGLIQLPWPKPFPLKESPKIMANSLFLLITFEHRLDTKARLVLPAKFRERLGDTLVAAIGMEHCVSLYSREEWENFTAWLKTSSFLDSERTRKLHRLILSSAHELALDGAGRILLPGVLRDYAALDQDVVVNGVNDQWCRQPKAWPAQRKFFSSFS